MHIQIDSDIKITGMDQDNTRDPVDIENKIKQYRSRQNITLREYIENLMDHRDPIKAYDQAKKIVE